MICSTIIPTIGRDTLMQSVQSALAQDVPAGEYEIIVVNDSGQPLELAAWLAERGVRVIDANRCRLNFVCNLGAAVAKGKYLKFLHDDDYLLPGGLRALVESAERTGATWVVGGSQVLDDGGGVLFTIDRPGLSGNWFATSVVGEVVHMSDCLISRQAFMEVGGFDPQVKISEDRDLECRLSLQGDVASTNHVVACVRVSGSAGSAYDFSNIVIYSRLVRERAFDAPGAFARIIDSVRSSAYLRGRTVRGYLYSGVLNLLARKVWLAGSRFTCGLRLANWHVVQPAFWRGVFHQQAKH
ncbi:MAG: Glycosyl transferase family 2 [Chloroflexi bacterium ADurb.Bin360]|nr:MAG: Glycosyl transferase family 2 [Chloroflexi bacterium ADurb.Bin360]